jgi:iron only hydrogenase large subunit-like protein
VLVKTYFAQKIKKSINQIAVVSIMPCVAKKFESRRKGENKSGNWDVDFVLTTREFIKMLKKAKINLPDLEETDFDSPLGEASGAGAIYGASGGVIESALRTVAYFAGEKKQPKIDYQELRGMEGIKQAKVRLAGYDLNIAIVTGLRNARKLIMEIKKGQQYDYIEVMACPGGCVGGGGQPKPASLKTINERRKALYQIDTQSKVRTAHENPVLQQVYQEFLGKVGSEKAKRYLHTNYQ